MAHLGQEGGFSEVRRLGGLLGGAQFRRLLAEHGKDRLKAFAFDRLQLVGLEVGHRGNENGPFDNEYGGEDGDRHHPGQAAGAQSLEIYFIRHGTHLIKPNGSHNSLILSQ